VANLMDLSRLRAGALTPLLESVPIEDLISSVVRRLRPALSDHAVRIRVRDDVPPVAMDVVQMDQALSNLLENAARFSPPGSEITIGAVRWHNMVEVKVVDHGPGILREDRARVFEEFYRKDVGGRRGGTGLGLSIARAVVMAHGGTMWVEDSPGGGATIGFRLPLARAAVEPAARGRPS
jgi:two-component system sensor histidine kinase KdpD